MGAPDPDFSGPGAFERALYPACVRAATADGSIRETGCHGFLRFQVTTNRLVFGHEPIWVGRSSPGV